MRKRRPAPWGVLAEARRALGGWAEPCRGPLALVQAGENATWQVLAPAGRLALRLYRPGRWTPAELETEHAFMAHLGPDLGVLPALPDRAGRQVHPLGEGRHAGLFPWVPGRRPRRPPGRAALGRLGELFGRLHARSAGFGAGLARVRWDRATLIDDAARRTRELLPRRLPDRDAAGLEGLAADLSARWGHGAFPLALLHADLHWGNLLVDGGRLRPIDFDDCGFGPLAYDLAVAAQATEVPDDQEDAVLATLLDGYAATAPARLDPREVELMRGARLMFFLSWILERPEVFPGARMGEWFDRTLGALVRVHRRIARRRPG